MNEQINQIKINGEINKETNKIVGKKNDKIKKENESAWRKRHS